MLAKEVILKQQNYKLNNFLRRNNNEKIFSISNGNGIGRNCFCLCCKPLLRCAGRPLAYDSVNKLASAGIVDGYGNGTFGGDRLMTRYEMAQIVAKAMAKGANVDRLAAEFADELDSLGVRVAALEKKSDNVKITGEARFRYADLKGKGNVADSYVGDLRSRIWITGQVNDDWSYTGMIQNIQDFAGDYTGDKKTDFQRAYVQGKLGGMAVTAGRYNAFFADGNIYDNRADGVELSYGDKVKLSLAAGKATDEITKLYVLEGSKPIEVPELHAGDIGAIAKLNSVQTGDSLATKANPILYPKALLSTPYTCKRFKAVKKGDEDKISQALAKMMSEDKTLRVVNDSANRQSLIYGIGDQHLDIVMNKLKERYKVDVELSKPKVPFRETIRKNADVEGKHKKQSGGHGQYGHVKMRFEPSGDLETPYEFEQVVVGGAVPKNYFPAVEKGLQECVLKGPLAAYPVVGVKATLYDGSYHPVDSSEMAFKMATILAFKKGFMDASPVLLEPIVSMKVTVPDKFTGDVMGDLNKRRGRVLGMTPDHQGNTIIEADVPQLEIYGYSTDLRSMTGGSGEFSYEFARYEQAPNDIQAKEIEARASKVDKAEE